jgi:hypothetical protein
MLRTPARGRDRLEEAIRRRHARLPSASELPEDDTSEAMCARILDFLPARHFVVE